MTLVEIIRDGLAILGVIAVAVDARRIWRWSKQRIALKQLSKEYLRAQRQPSPPINDGEDYGVGASG